VTFSLGTGSALFLGQTEAAEGNKPINKGRVWLHVYGLARLCGCRCWAIGWLHVGLSLSGSVQKQPVSLAPRKREWNPFLPGQARGMQHVSKLMIVLASD
jgi:hypothetical protein